MAAVVLAGVPAPTASAASDTVFAWGGNFVSTPTQAKLPAGVRIKDIDGDHGLMLTVDGRVLSWPGGNNPTTTLPTEVPFPAGITITAIAAGNRHNLALTSDGRVLAWGDNDHGQLGNGSKQPSATPVWVQLPSGAKITGIDAGFRHSLAVTSDGRVLAWGDNTYGQLGDPSAVDLKESTTPVQVHWAGLLNDFISVAAGNTHSVALTETGWVYAWGRNDWGQTGRGTGGPNGVQYPPVHVLIPPQTRIVKIDAGANAQHTLAIDAGGRLFGWGFNVTDQVGAGQDSPNNCVSKWEHPTLQIDCPRLLALPEGTRVRDVAAGQGYSLAVTTTGQVLSWGADIDGQLGDPTVPQRDRPGPVQIPGNVKIARVTGNGYASYALPAVPDPTTTVLAAVPVRELSGNPVTFTATVTCPNATPTGTVTFLEGTAERGTRALKDATATTARAELVLTDLALGAHTLTARYNGDLECEVSTSGPVTVTIVDCGCDNNGGGGGGHGGHKPGKGKVVSKHMLTVRQAPRIDAKAVGTLRAGQTIAIRCKATGQPVGGNNRWYKLARDPRGWVTARYVKNLNSIPRCPS
ncbi:Ig-like domain repeat protein [Streptomyces sp. DG1A-41]|uniref:RCC1 domain-containing protein n=1 Tax=Streptomyces sp. DG1A-41 TaxID=3125779 RepID=UPI0030CD0B97